jgi:hypothetical protein
LPEYVKRAPAIPPTYTAHRYQFGEPVDGELLNLVRRGSIDAEAVEVPQWRSLLVRSGAGIGGVVLVDDGMCLVYEHERSYLTAWTDERVPRRVRDRDRRTA